MRVSWILAVLVVGVALTGCLTDGDGTPGGPTPAPEFGEWIGMTGYPLVTTEQVGDIAAGARVRVSHAEFRDNAWIYTVVAEDEVTIAEATDAQLELSPDVTPGPTPTS